MTLREGDVLKLGNVIVKVVKIKFEIDSFYQDEVQSINKSLTNVSEFKTIGSTQNSTSKMRKLP